MIISLARWTGVRNGQLAHLLADTLRVFDAELEQLPVSARRCPDRPFSPASSCWSIAA